MLSDDWRYRISFYVHWMLGMFHSEISVRRIFGLYIANMITFQTLQPNQQDLLRLRKKTTGIREEVYEIKGTLHYVLL